MRLGNVRTALNLCWLCYMALPYDQHYIDGSVQDGSIYSALAMEILKSCKAIDLMNTIEKIDIWSFQERLFLSSTF